MLGCLILVALLADSRMTPAGQRIHAAAQRRHDSRHADDDPPRASITEVADDLKARDVLLRSFPEVELVVGKAGRAETPTDPAPPDMVETVVNLRPREHWPKRELRFDDAKRQTDDILKSFVSRGWIAQPTSEQQKDLTGDATMFALEAFDKSTRDMANQDYVQFENELGPQLTAFAVKETVRLIGSAGQTAPSTD